MATPLSNATAYCTNAQALQFLDARQVADLVGDRSVRTGGIFPEAVLSTDPTLTAALQAASGEVEASCCVSQRYAPADLAALTGVSAVFLQKLVARLAYGDLFSRRNPDKPVPPVVEWAEKKLDALRAGEMIFGILENQQAGNLSTPQFLDVGTIQLVGLSTYLTSRYFGQRADLERIGVAQGSSPSWPT